MSKLNLKLKSDLKKQITEEKEKKGGSDPRLLNYFDMKEGQKMKVLLVPDVNGELWLRFKKHGPNLKNRAIPDIGCVYSQSGDNCPACQKGFDLLALEKETGDKSYKDEAKRWFGKESTIVSCIVLDSPIEIREASDHNQVKLMYLPFAIESMIKESIMEGQIDENELTTTPLVIKMTKNAGGHSEYKHSYFDRSRISDEDLEVFDDMVVEQYDYSNIDLAPAPTTTEAVQEWLDKAEELDEKAKEHAAQNNSAGKVSVRDRLAGKLGKTETKDEAPEKEEQVLDDGGDNDDAPQQEEKSAPQSSIRDRLARLKK